VSCAPLLTSPVDGELTPLLTSPVDGGGSVTPSPPAGRVGVGQVLPARGEGRGGGKSSPPAGRAGVGARTRKNVVW
jgi:hypothetical protein